MPVTTIFRIALDRVLSEEILQSNQIYQAKLDQCLSHLDALSKVVYRQICQDQNADDPDYVYDEDRPVVMLDESLQVYYALKFIFNKKIVDARKNIDFLRIHDDGIFLNGYNNNRSETNHLTLLSPQLEDAIKCTFDLQILKVDPLKLYQVTIEVQEPVNDSNHYRKIGRNAYDIIDYLKKE